MLGLVDYVIWLIGFLAEVFLLARAVVRKDFLRYLSLNLYVSALACGSVAMFLIARAYGFESIQYRYFYYYNDAVITIIMFIAVIGLYLHVFEEMHLGKYVRGLAVVLLGGTAAISLLAVQRNTGNLTGRFVVELGQNLYFIGVAMTYILWASMLKVRTTRLRLILIVSTFGLFFSLQAATYGLRNLFPALAIWHAIPPLVGAWLPLSLAFAFTRVPDEARILTARIAGARQ